MECTTQTFNVLNLVLNVQRSKVMMIITQLLWHVEQGNLVCAHSLAICERGIESLGFNTSQFNGTRVTQQMKTPHTFFHNVKDGVFNELELRKLIFLITSMITEVFYNY
jgi:hypothetical protein